VCSSDLDDVNATPTPARLLFDVFLRETGIAETMINPQAGISECMKWADAGVTAELVTAAIQELQAKNYSIVAPKSITNSINIVRSKGNGRHRPGEPLGYAGIREYLEEERLRNEPNND